VELNVYRTVPASPDEDTLKRITGEPVDYFTFASSSTTENLAGIVGKEKFIGLSNESSFISIGPVTSEKIRELGGRVKREAERSDIDGLVDAIIADAVEDKR